MFNEDARIPMGLTPGAVHEYAAADRSVLVETRPALALGERDVSRHVGDA